MKTLNVALTIPETEQELSDLLGFKNNVFENPEAAGLIQVESNEDGVELYNISKCVNGHSTSQEFYIEIEKDEFNTNLRIAKTCRLKNRKSENYFDFTFTENSILSWVGENRTVNDRVEKNKYVFYIDLDKSTNKYLSGDLIYVSANIMEANEILQGYALRAGPDSILRRDQQNSVGPYNATFTLSDQDRTTQPPLRPTKPFQQSLAL